MTVGRTATMWVFHYLRWCFRSDRESWVLRAFSAYTHLTDWHTHTHPARLTCHSFLSFSWFSPEDRSRDGSWHLGGLSAVWTQNATRRAQIAWLWLWIEVWKCGVNIFYWKRGEGLRLLSVLPSTDPCTAFYTQPPKSFSDRQKLMDEPRFSSDSAVIFIFPPEYWFSDDQ